MLAAIRQNELRSVTTNVEALVKESRESNPCYYEWTGQLPRDNCGSMDSTGEQPR